MPNPVQSPTWISPEGAAFIQQGVSINVASRDVRHVPSISRALGCRIAPDGRTLDIILNATQCETLIRDLQKTAAIAVVFSQPTTHRSLQIKGCDAVVKPATDADCDLVAFTRTAFGSEIAPLGFPPAFCDRLFMHGPDDLCVVTFTPDAVFQQTPGVGAGARLDVVS